MLRLIDHIHKNNQLLDWPLLGLKLNIHTEKQWCSHWGGARGQSATPGSEKFVKIGVKREKIRKNRQKEENIRKKGKNREGSFTLPLLTDRAG